MPQEPRKQTRRARPDHEKAAPASGKPPDPARIFNIPEEVKYLQPEQLSALTEAFRAWRQAAKGPARRQARGRVWLVYLLLRFTAGRLGEVLALDDRRDLDLAQGVVNLGGEGTGQAPGGRQVQIPEDMARDIADFLRDPAQRGLRGQVLRLDQGYMRRQFRARAADCGLPSALANPRVLRNSRAIELLRQGVPLTIVQEILGQGSVNLTANYLSFAREDRERIVRYHLGRETRLRTSARNSFQGRITRITRGSLQSQVELISTGGFEIVSVITNDSLAILSLRRGMPVTALVKAPWVIISQGPDIPRISARNRLPGRLSKITADAVSSEVMVELSDGTQVCALITGQSARELGLAVGDQVWAVFKSSAVIITTD
ncbi:MAG: TOBE domain-containing protein [Pseudomonadota bacterium]